MRPRILSLGVGLVAALAVVASPVAAGGRVEITLDVNFGTGVETFTAEGAFCPDGDAVTLGSRATGRGATVFHVVKELTCADGSGTLLIRLDAPFIGVRGGTIGGWRVLDGTGDYAGLAGGGQIVGTGTPTGIVDVYTGQLR
jgi:hypothetical protein